MTINWLADEFSKGEGISDTVYKICQYKSNIKSEIYFYFQSCRLKHHHSRGLEESKKQALCMIENNTK